MVNNRLCSGVVCTALALVCSTAAQDLQPVQLPPPDTRGGKPLMAALSARESTREFSPDEIPLDKLSELLWAACGINRPESGKRTAPSALNNQEIDVYVVTAFAVYRYQGAQHMLDPVAQQDLRGATGKQNFVKNAAVNLVYVADYSRMNKVTEQQKPVYAAADAAFIGQNVYLYCASAGLATVIRGSIDKEMLAKALNLKPSQHVVLAQTVGYPKKKKGK